MQTCCCGNSLIVISGSLHREFIQLTQYNLYNLHQVKVDTVYIPATNIGISDVPLYPWIDINTLREVYVVSLPSGFTVVPSYQVTVYQSCDSYSPSLFSTMDLASGYNQVLVAEAHQPKIAFCTTFGLLSGIICHEAMCLAISSRLRNESLMISSASRYYNTSIRTWYYLLPFQNVLSS